MTIALAATPARAGECDWSFPVGAAPESPAPLSNNHPVNGNNLPAYGAHLGADFWSGGGCTDLGQAVFAVADGQVVEIVDALGSYLDVVVIRHQVQDIGNVYSMYGHIERDGALSEGQMVEARQKIGEIDDVLAYFSPCHVHVELLNEAAYQDGPFCNGCANAGFHVSPGYDQNQGVTLGTDVTGDDYIEVNDGIAGNRWYFVSEFLEARVGMECGSCGDGVCDPGETAQSCPEDCGGGSDGGDGDTGWGGTETSGGSDTGWGEESGSGSGEDTGATDGTDDTGTGGPGAGDFFDRGGESGCACATSPGPSGALGGALFGLGLLLRRRRRGKSEP